MNRVIVAAFLFATLAGTSACTDSTHTAKLELNEPMQMSSIHWDELAAADQAAHVSNNGLIMMR